MAEPSQPTVLCVDDEPDVLDVLKRSLSRRYEVLVATSGAEGLALLRERVRGPSPIRVLLTDQKMPEMTGVELAAAARAEGITPTVILLTGYAEPEAAIAAINEGQVQRYLTKPWDLPELLIAVKNGVEHAELTEEKERLLQQLHKRAEALSVLFEVSQGAAEGPATLDALMDRFLAAVSRVLPYDCGAALVANSSGKGTLRLACRGRVAEAGLLRAKEEVLTAYERQSGSGVSEGQLVTRVRGSASSDEDAVERFEGALLVPLRSGERQVGTLGLFSAVAWPDAPSDAALLETLANRTAAAVLALRAEEEAQARRIEQMVASMADGVLLADESHHLAVVNPAARRLLRLSDDPEEWTVRNLQERLGFYPFELLRDWTHEPGRVLREEVRVFDRTLSSTVTTVVDGGGASRGVCVILRDISEERALQTRKEELVSVVSHELRTPLSSISGALDLVLGRLAGEVNEKQERFLTMARESADKLNSIVDDLLDIGRQEQGGLRMSFELTQVDELLSAAIERFGPVLLEKRIRLEAERGPRVRALADPGRLTQVLHNLLANALKFAPEGGDLRVSIGMSEDLPGFVRISFWNDGASIPAPDLERIFEKFEQASPGRSVSGTGLGLAISRGIVEAHGGQIWAEPCDAGARFVMVLPLQPTAEHMERMAELAEPRQAAAEEVIGRVLIVEDDPNLAFVMKALLLTRGFKVAVAHDADEAVMAGRELSPDVIVLDVGLPGPVDGLALAEIFRNDPDTRRARLLVCSGRDERERAYRMGAANFLKKPLESEGFLAAVAGLAREGDGSAGRILVVDDDVKIAAICSEVLQNVGYEVAAVGTLADAWRHVHEARPDAILLDVTLPDGDGFAFLEALKAERVTGRLPVLFVSARGETSAKVQAFKLGAADYLVKPFDALELAARLESVLRRRELEQGASPTTQLPGSGAIEREVEARLEERRRFALCYLDLDNLKAYNDYYGFAKADGVIRQTGELIAEVIAERGAPDDFIGHVAGDDFVFLTELSTVDAVCNGLTETFDRIIPLYYDRADRERGYIEAEDRFGVRRRFPIMSVSIAAVIVDGPTEHAQLAKAAALLKKRAKAAEGSVYLRGDGRSTDRSIA